MLPCSYQKCHGTGCKDACPDYGTGCIASIKENYCVCRPGYIDDNKYGCKQANCEVYTLKNDENEDSSACKVIQDGSGCIFKDQFCVCDIKNGYYPNANGKCLKTLTCNNSYFFNKSNCTDRGVGCKNPDTENNTCVCDTENDFVVLGDGSCGCDASKNLILVDGRCVCKPGYQGNPCSQVSCADYEVKEGEDAQVACMATSGLNGCIASPDVSRRCKCDEASGAGFGPDGNCVSGIQCTNAFFFIGQTVCQNYQNGCIPPENNGERCMCDVRSGYIAKEDGTCACDASNGFQEEKDGQCVQKNDIGKNKNQGRMNIGIIVGIVLGVLILIAIIVLTIVLVRKRVKSMKNKNNSLKKVQEIHESAKRRIVGMIDDNNQLI